MAERWLSVANAKSDTTQIALEYLKQCSTAARNGNVATAEHANVHFFGLHPAVFTVQLVHS